MIGCFVLGAGPVQRYSLAGPNGVSNYREGDCLGGGGGCADGRSVAGDNCQAGKEPASERARRVAEAGIAGWAGASEADLRHGERSGVVCVTAETGEADAAVDVLQGAKGAGEVGVGAADEADMASDKWGALLGRGGWSADRCGGVGTNEEASEG